PATANTFRVLGPDLERQADRGDGLRREVRDGPVRRRHALVVHVLSLAARLFHPLGRCIQVRGLSARPADRGLSALAAPASGAARRRTGADTHGLSALRIDRRIAPSWGPVTGCGRHYR